MYSGFHLVTVEQGFGICAHPARILSAEPTEFFAPFKDEDEAAVFVQAILQAQSEVIHEMERCRKTEAEVS